MTDRPVAPPPSNIQGRPLAANLRPAGLPPVGIQPPVGKLPTPPRPVAAPATPSAMPKAELKQSPLRFLPMILGILLVAGLAFFIYRVLFANKQTTSTTPTGQTQSTTTKTASTAITLTYWGLWEPNQIFQEVLSDFESSHPGVTVKYQMDTYRDYRERVQTAIAQNRGPDIFRFHASWTPMLQNELAAVPNTIYSTTDYQSIFYPAAYQLLSLNGQILGIPLMYDGLALYYNEDALRAANAQPPKTWAELKDLAMRLTIRSGNKIQRAGLAIGSSSNVDHFSDILGLLILQNGGAPTDLTSQNATDALTFYTNFVKTDKVWDDTFASSTLAFARGEVAMMFAPSWRVHEIKNLAPNLKFSIVTVPQLTSNKVSWANFWAEGVSSQSKHKTEAWQLLQYLSSPAVLRKLYSTASKNRTFGEIYPRQDMAADLASDPLINPYLSDAPYSKGWYMSSATHDNGLNDQIIKYFQDGVTAVLGNTAPATALMTVSSGVSQILRQYNVAQ